MSKIIDIFMAPTKVFTSLKERPEWLAPLIIILVVVAMSTSLTLSITRDTIIAKQEEMLRERGLTEEQIEQAMKLSQSSAAVVFGALSAVIFTVIVLLVFAFFVNLFIPVFGGRGAFKPVFSVICYSALVTSLGGILRLILVAITKSPYITTSLALFVPGLAKDSFAYKILAGFDFFVIWMIILVALGINITNEIEKKNAYILLFLIWIVSIFVGIVLGLFVPRA